VDADRDLMRLFERVWIPNEHFVQTIVGNSPFRDRIAHADRSGALKGVHYVDWERGSPKILGVEDFERLLASPALFARTFNRTEDPVILDMIDAHLTQTEGSVAS
jgi:hypothetical protein